MVPGSISGNQISKIVTCVLGMRCKRERNYINGYSH